MIRKEISVCWIPVCKEDTCEYYNNMKLTACEITGNILATNSKEGNILFFCKHFKIKTEDKNG